MLVKKRVVNGIMIVGVDDCFMGDIDIVSYGQTACIVNITAIAQMDIATDIYCFGRDFGALPLLL